MSDDTDSQLGILRTLAERSISTKYELAQQLGISWSAADHILAGLKDRGLVSRAGVAVTLTTLGERLIRQTQVEVIAQQLALAGQQEEAQRISGTPPYDLPDLLSALAQVREIIANPYTDYHVGVMLRQVHAGTAIQQAEELIAWLHNQMRNR